MKPRQVLGKYLEVYGQGNPITPEAGKKRAPFFKNYEFSGNSREMTSYFILQHMRYKNSFRYAAEIIVLNR